MGTSYLTLGDMLTFIGLIIAVYQLAKPRYLLVWKLSSGLLKSLAVLLLIVGYVSPLASIFTPTDTQIAIFGTELSLGQYLQVVGFLLITIGVLIVGYIYSTYNRKHLLTYLTSYKFNHHRYPRKGWRTLSINVERKKIATTRSAIKFYAITSRYLVRGHTEEVVEIIGHNIKALVGSARQYSPERYRIRENENEEPPKPNGANYCFETLLQLLSDDVAMRHICTNNRPFLYAIIWQEKEGSGGGYRNEFAYVLYENVVKHLVLNGDSFLYTQIDTHEGSARFANIYDFLTDEKITRRHNIIPSQLTWQVSKSSVPLDAYTEVMAKLLEKIVEGYKKQPSEDERIVNIRAILDQLMGDSGVTRRIAYDKKSRAKYAEDPVNSVEANVLQALDMHVIGNLFRADDPEVFQKDKRELSSENKKSRFDQKTLTGIAAYKVCELIEDITILNMDTDNEDFNVRRTMFDYLRIYVDTPIAKHYKKLVLDYLFDKAIDGKLSITTNMQGYYPNVFKPLLDYLVPFTPRGNDEVDNAAIHRMKAIMNNELKDALLKGKKMANDELMKDVLLPSSVEVIISKAKKSVTYRYINRKGKKTTLKLDTPTATVVKGKTASQKAASSKK